MCGTRSFWPTAAFATWSPGVVVSDPNTLNALGLFETCLGKREDAMRLFERSLAVKPDQPGVVESLNVVKRGISPKG